MLRTHKNTVLLYKNKCVRVYAPKKGSVHILRAGKKAIAKSITKTLLWLNLNVCSLTAKTCFSKSVCYIMKNSVCRGIRGIVSLLKPPFLVGSFSTAQKQLRQSKVCIFLQFQRGILSVSAIKVCVRDCTSVKEKTSLLLYYSKTTKRSSF